MRITLLSSASALVCTDDCCNDKEAELSALAALPGQRRVLVLVLAINVVMFGIEAWAGIMARSVALIADSVDMFGDATVYGLSLYALGRGLRWRAGAALAKGVIILAFGGWILVEVGRRLMAGGVPEAQTIGAVGLLALAANLTCLGLLWRFRSHDVNMSSTWECSRNDVVANVGVLVAAGGVWLTGAAWPDIVVGLLVAALFLRSAWSVLRTAWPQFRSGHSEAHEHREVGVPRAAPLEFVAFENRNPLE
jgi:cation diffusion facilitator family transporter